MRRSNGISSVIIYGCIWGLLELTLGGYLHYIHYPLKGQVMTVIGCMLLTSYVARYRRIWNPVFIGVIAASFKVLNVFIFKVPLLSMSIVNPAISIVMEASAVTAVSFVFSRVFKVRALSPRRS